MDGEAKLESLGETLEKLTADPELCATLVFPTTGITVTLHSAGEDQWDMITRSEVRGVFDVAKIDEESLMFRLAAADMVEKIATDIMTERATPKLMADLESMLAAEAQK